MPKMRTCALLLIIICECCWLTVMTWKQSQHMRISISCRYPYRPNALCVQALTQLWLTPCRCRKTLELLQCAVLQSSHYYYYCAFNIHSTSFNYFVRPSGVCKHTREPGSKAPHRQKHVQCHAMICHGPCTSPWGLSTFWNRMERLCARVCP